MRENTPKCNSRKTSSCPGTLPAEPWSCVRSAFFESLLESLWASGILASCLSTSFLPNSVILISCQASQHLEHVATIPPRVPGNIKRLTQPLYQQEERSDGLWREKGPLIAGLISPWLPLLPLSDLFAYLIFGRLSDGASTVLGLDKPAFPSACSSHPVSSANFCSVSRREPIFWDEDLQKHVFKMYQQRTG